jgi:preprotein translocase subunit Sec61beta
LKEKGLAMGRKNKIRMPSSEGGIVRYFDEEYHSKIMVKPMIVIGLVIAIIVMFTIINLI